MTLADLFPAEDYRFHLRFERGTVGEFFRPTSRHDELMAQRRHWLQTAPQTHAALLPEGVPLLEDALDLARETQTLPPNSSGLPLPVGRGEGRGEGAILLTGSNGAWPRCLELGMSWEPDFL